MCLCALPGILTMGNTLENRNIFLHSLHSLLFDARLIPTTSNVSRQYFIGCFIFAINVTGKKV